jgi:putative endonuclease
MDKQGYVYLLMNISNSVIYTGVTSDLKKRVYEHREKLIDGFTVNAIEREKQIKGGSRQKKLDLAGKMNASFRDLYDTL